MKRLLLVLLLSPVLVLAQPPSTNAKKIQGRRVCADVPNDGDVIVWSASSNCYKPSTAGASTAYGTVTDASPIAWDLLSPNVTNGVVTLNHATATRALNVSNLVNGGFYTLIVTQDSTGGASVTSGLPPPAAPTSNAPTSGGACTAGTHLWAVTFLSATGESAIGAASASQDCTTNHTEGLTVIPIGLASTTGRNIYRTKAGTTTPYFLACASAPCINNNSTTIFSDSLADASLGVNPPTWNTTGGCIWMTPGGLGNGVLPISTAANDINTIAFTYDGSHCLMVPAAAYRGN